MTQANADRSRRHLLCAALAALAAPAIDLGAAAARSTAQHILCSGPAGSIPDLIARAVGDQLRLALAQPVVIDNRPGAAGQISVGALLAAPADGSTLLLAQGAIATVYPFLYAKLAYDAALDLQPVSLAGEMGLGLAVGPAVPAQVATLDEFIAWMRQHPGSANVGSPGTGTLPHLLAAMLLGGAGVAWQHVAYAGGPPAINDLLGGQIAALVLPEGLLQQHHAARRVPGAGHLEAGAQHLPARGAVFRRVGRPDLVVKEWFAFFASARVAKSTVEAMSSALQDAIARRTCRSCIARRHDGRCRVRRPR